MTSRRDLFGLGLGAGLGALGLRSLAGVRSLAHTPVTCDQLELRLYRQLLQSSVVGPADIGPVLYSWTRLDQIQAIAASPVIDAPFMASAAVGNSTFDRSIRGGPLREALDRLPYRQRRFAWPNPWATVRGWTRSARGIEGDYGRHLLRLVTHPIEFARVRNGEAIEAPGTLAAVYHEFESGGRAMREVVVLPGALESWSYGTAEIRSELLEAAELLETLATLAPLPERVDRRDVWSGEKRLGDLALAYVANLALGSRNYAATPAQLLATARTLRDAVEIQGPPIEAKRQPSVYCHEVW